MGGYRVPYAPSLRDLYDHRNSRITDLLMRQGDIQANRAHDSGQIWGHAIQNIGQQVAGGIQQHAELKEQSKRSKAFDAAIATGDPKEIIRVLGPKDGPAVVNALKATTPDGMKQYTDRMALLRDTARGVLAVPPENRQQAYEYARNSLLQGGVIKPEEVPEQYDEGLLRQASAYGAEPAKTQGLMNVPPENTVLDPTTGQPVFTAPPKAATPPEPRVVGRSLVGPDGKVIYRDPEGPKAEGAKFWVMRNGKPLRVSEAEYQPGDTPASTREQGRPVVSGDAGRIADFDTSLDDLNTLARDIGVTGTGSKIGAMLPDAITNLTGWGADSKARQAVIDRVKQVIGKALEGGVLRKEDEVKYEKILPKIGDEPTVAASKLKGLWEAITQRRQTLIDSLGDAGYDTTKYSARAPRERTAGPKQIKNDAEYNALPSGTEYISPDGKRRRKQ